MTYACTPTQMQMLSLPLREMMVSNSRPPLVHRMGHTISRPVQVQHSPQDTPQSGSNRLPPRPSAQLQSCPCLYPHPRINPSRAARPRPRLHPGSLLPDQRQVYFHITHPPYQHQLRCLPQHMAMVYVHQSEQQGPPCRWLNHSPGMAHPQPQPQPRPRPH